MEKAILSSSHESFEKKISKNCMNLPMVKGEYYKNWFNFRQKAARFCTCFGKFESQLIREIISTEAKWWKLISIRDAQSNLPELNRRQPFLQDKC